MHQNCTKTLPWRHMGGKASHITSRSTVYSGNLKPPFCWHFLWESIGDRWFPPQRASNADSVSISWRHHVKSHLVSTPAKHMIGPIHYYDISCWLEVTFSLQTESMRKWHMIYWRAFSCMTTWECWDNAHCLFVVLVRCVVNSLRPGDVMWRHRSGWISSLLAGSRLNIKTAFTV